MNSPVLKIGGGSPARSARRMPECPGVMAALFTVSLLLAGCGSSTRTTTATPVFTPGAGSYSSTQDVTVADTDQNAVLYCTNDGSVPTASSPQCANPIRVAQSQTLNAIAIASGMAPSAVATAAYTITGSTAAPTVTGIGAASGPSGGGTPVTIVGASFIDVTAVKFGTTPATSFTVNSTTSITAISPPGSGSVHITVVAAGGTSATTAADLFNYGTAPAITGLSPASATVGGAGLTLTVSGDNFTPDAVVQWAGTPLATTFVSTMQLTAAVPASLLATAGAPTVTVTESGGASSGVAFAINAAAPAIVAISPSQGPLTGGTMVSIIGSNLTGVSAVKFGAAAAASFTVVSATTITAVSPAGSAGTVDIQVVTASGASATGTSDQFTYLAPPAITGVSPATGSSAGGTTVEISGINLAGATSVSFGAAAAASFTVTSATGITAVSPAGSAGTVDIRVVTPGGVSAATGADQFLYALPVPAVTGLSVTAGKIAGGTTVNITGANLTGATAVDFGATPAASFTVTSAAGITAVTPPESAATVDVTVVTPFGTSATSAADQFTFTSGPVITSVTPSAGPLAGGAAVTLKGENLSGAMVAFGNNNPATSVSVSADGETISAISPAGGAGTVDIIVTTAAGTSAMSAADQFTYVPVPVVSGVTPASGSTLGGTAVTITGTSFSGKGYTVTAVDFGGSNPATGVTVSADGSMISATSPAGSAGTANLVVVTPGGTSGPVQFTYAPPPVVSAVAPSSGPATGGTAVTITGTGFTGATAVDFGSNNPATGVTVSADGSTISATSPAGSAGTVDVTVVTPVGTSATGSADQFTYASTISGVVQSGAGTGGAAAPLAASVQLYAAGTSGYGSTPQPLGDAVESDPATGAFSMPYDCSTLAPPGDQLYLKAVENNQVVLMTALGTCSNIGSSFPGGVTINEATTIASAYALAEFAAGDPSGGIDIGAPGAGPSCNVAANWQSTGPSTCNYLGLRNAFATVGNLVDIPSGTALSVTPYYRNNPGAGAGYNISQVPQARINSLANVLASCVNPTTGGSSNCGSLFTDTTNAGSTPADTLQAAMSIAQHPGSNAGQITTLAGADSTFSPALSSTQLSALTDWALALVYQGAGLGNGPVTSASLLPVGLAADAQGNLWIPVDQTSSNGLVAVFSNLGVPLSPSSTSASDPGGYTGSGSIVSPRSIAIDQNGDAWIGNSSSTTADTAGSVTVLDVNGNAKFGSPYKDSRLFLPTSSGMAIDANNNVWVASSVAGGPCSSSIGGSILQLFVTGGSITATGVAADSVSDNTSCPTFVAIDPQGNLWTYDQGSFNGEDATFAQALDLFSAAASTSGLANLTGGPYWNDAPVYPPTTPNVAFDNMANAWFVASFTALQQSGPGTNTAYSGIAKMVNLGGTVGNGLTSVGADPTVFAPEGLSSGTPFQSTVAVDGNSNAWIVGSSAGLFEINNSDAAVLSPAEGFMGYDNSGLSPASGDPANRLDTAIDNSGNVWVVSPGLTIAVSGGSTLAEFVGIAAPVSTPLVSGLVGKNVGARP